MRTHDDQVGAPLRRAIQDALPRVAYLDSGLGLESSAAQLLRNTVDQRARGHLLAFQLRSKIPIHLRGRRRNRLQAVEDHNLCRLRPAARDNRSEEHTSEL